MTPDAYGAFLDSVGAGARPGLVDVYHAVRRIRYGSTGERRPEMVIRRQLGSCSGKHLLLSDLLRRVGYETEIVTIFAHFNKGMPVCDSYPAELARICREEEVPDYHHFVRARIDGGWIRLDATWHDALAPFGFPVNLDWNGEGDTVLAATPLRDYPPTDDLIALKERLIAELPPDRRELRARFFKLLTDWIAGLESPP